MVEEAIVDIGLAGLAIADQVRRDAAAERGDMDGLYVAVMHSGITLAPAVGLFAAREILDGERDPLLAPYGLSRFAQ